MHANSRDTLEVVAEQLGHCNQTMTERYLAKMPAISKADARDLAVKVAIDIFDGEFNSIGLEHFRETSMGICPSRSRKTYKSRPCLTAPMARWEPSTWDVSDEMVESAQPSMASNLVRCWSDLDRTSQLAAHLAAQEF